MTIFFEKPTRHNFKKALKEGNMSEDWLADRLREAGIPDVEQPEYISGMARSYYTKNQVDLVANGHILEVKGRSLRFTGVSDFPYSSLFVESVSGFDQKVNVPDFYVNISLPTKAVIALDVAATYDKWFKHMTPARNTVNPYEMYSAPIELWMDYADLLERLK